VRVANRVRATLREVLEHDLCAHAGVFLDLGQRESGLVSIGSVVFADAGAADLREIRENLGDLRLAFACAPTIRRELGRVRAEPA
jgi:hypothetical protein